MKACVQGYGMLFKNVATLSTELCEVKDNYHPGKQERILEKANLLILDHSTRSLPDNERSKRSAGNAETQVEIMRLF